MKKLFTLLFCSLLYVAVAHGEVTHSLSGTTLTISYSGSGSTEMEDYEDFSSGTKRRPAAWSNIKTLIIEEGVTTIGAYAFDDCLNLTSVTIPASMKVMKTAAFQGCTGVKEVHATSPNDWAGIEFQTRTASSNGKVYCDSHPFGMSMSSYTHSFFFYGQGTETIDLVFRPGITTIKSYAFKNANKIENVYLPNSVASIGDYAFDCKIKRLYVNNTSTPTTGTDAFTFKTGSTYLYLPAGANASTSTGYKRTPWYDGGYGKGAKFIGYEGPDKSASSTGNDFNVSKSKVHPTSGTVNGVKWELGADGVMTFTGPGTITTSFVNSTGNAALYPWWRFCNLVDKVKVVGEVKGLSNAMRYFNAVTEIIIEQTSMPTASHLANGTSSTLFEGLINKTDNVILSIKPATLTHSSTTNLSSAPWKEERVSIALSEPLVLNENEDQTTLMDRVSDYVEEPFTLELGRTLSNAYANTFCSPINMNADLIAATFGAGTQVYTLTDSKFSEAENDLTLAFDLQTTITAGKPYIIHPATTVTNPSITGVQPSTLSSSADNVTSDYVTFYGTLTPREVTEGEKANSSFIFLQANDQLAWANEGTLKGMRAYFILNDNVADNIKKARPIMRLGNSATAITIVGAEPQAGEVQKIIRDGQMLIIRDGKTYNAMGMIVE